MLAAVLSAVGQTTDGFRVGEKFSFNVSFDQFGNVAFLEMATVSRGKFANRDAVELYARVKTYEIVSAAFTQIDERRTVFAAADSGLPLYIDRTAATGGIPKKRVVNNLDIATPSLDMVTMIQRARVAGANGSFTFSEDGETYVITFASGASEKLKTDEGEFDTIVTTIQSTFFDTYGIKDLRVNFTADERRIPVGFKFTTSKGTFEGRLVGLTEPPAPPTDVKPTPTPTPRPTATPVPTPVRPTYVNDQPLLPELAFSLGEKLEYKLTAAGQQAGDLILEAKERRLVQNADMLTLTATISNPAPQIRGLVANEAMIARVNPDTLAPYTFDLNLTGTLATNAQKLVFDSRTGGVLAASGKIDSPIGTHSLLSLLYAMRSFNLKPSKVSTNPVNDTRVAVFWAGKPYIFVLRPSLADSITIAGEKYPSQLVSINTGNPQLDALQIKVWLSLDSKRTPLRIQFGAYTADLVIRDATLFR